MVIYHYESDIQDQTAASNIHRLIEEQPVLQQRFNKVHVIYGYAPFVLIPNQFMNGTDNNAMLELVYGENGERVVRTDFLYRHAIHIAYAVPGVINHVVTRYFPLAQFTHLFFLLPDIIKNPVNDLYCIFSTGLLKVLLVKEGKLQVMQTFCYKTPEDVAYYLLSTCKSFDVNEKEVNVTLAGMIDESSPLYAELYKYFLLLNFEQLPVQFQYPDEIKEYPQHYFSHLFAIAACV